MARIPSRRILVLAFGATVTVAVVAHLRAAKRRGEPAGPSSVPGASGDGVVSRSEAAVGVAEVVKPAATNDVPDVAVTPAPSSSAAGSEGAITVFGPAPDLPSAFSTEGGEPALELDPESAPVAVEPKSVLEPVGEVEPELLAESELVAELEPELLAESELVAELEPVGEGEPELAAEPVDAVAADAECAPELETSGAAEPAIDVELARGPVSQSVWEREPVSEAQPAVDPEPEFRARTDVEGAPVLEPESEPVDESVASVEVEVPARDTQAVVVAELTETESTPASHEVGHETAEPESWEWVAAGGTTASSEAEVATAEGVVDEPAPSEHGQYAGPWRRAADFDPLADEDSAYDGPQRRSSDGDGERARLLAAAIAEQHAEEDARREERAKRPPAPPMADRPSVEIVVLTGPLAEDV